MFTSTVYSRLRVIDISQGWAGPFLTAILADMGAQVIKVESIQHPDWWRGFAPDTESSTEALWERSFLFNSIGRNKLGSTINLEHPLGRELLLRLVRIGDVMVENFTPRVIEKLALTYDVLGQVNPRLVMISMPGYGRTGPYRGYPALGTTTDSMSGWASVTGYEGGPPRLQNPSGDTIVGLHGAVAVLLALRHRDKTGKGQFIEMSHIEACTSLLGRQIMDYVMNKRIAERRGNRHPCLAPHGVYPCRGNDAWVAIAVRDDAAWRRCTDAMGHPEWAEDPRWATLLERLQHQRELDPLISQWTSQREPLKVQETLQAAGIAAGVVHSGATQLGDPHLASRGFFFVQDRAYVGPHPYPGSPLRFSRTPVNMRMPAPTLGEHNKPVLGELLGLSDAELEHLEREEVIGTRPVEFK